jgi:hypothetical protein
MPQSSPNQLDSMHATQGVTPPLGSGNTGTIALLDQWAREDATNDPGAVAQAELELAGLKAALNANRPSGRPVFP